MADTTRANPRTTTPQMNMANDPRPEAVHSNPQTGEFPAGSGKAGLKDYHDENAGNPGTKWSTKNIVIGLGVAVLVIVVLMMLF